MLCLKEVCLGVCECVLPDALTQLHWILISSKWLVQPLMSSNVSLQCFSFWFCRSRRSKPLHCPPWTHTCCLLLVLQLQCTSPFPSRSKHPQWPITFLRQKRCDVGKEVRLIMQTAGWGWARTRNAAIQTDNYRDGNGAELQPTTSNDERWEE